MGDEAKLFSGARPQFYFHGARLKKDNKTGSIFWLLNLIITCVPEEIAKCSDILCANYAAIETIDNRITSLAIDLIVLDQQLQFFPLVDSKKPAFTFASVDLEDLRFTRNEKLTEFWIALAIPASDEVWGFVKESAFTRLWVEFKPAKSAFALK